MPTGFKRHMPNVPSHLPKISTRTRQEEGKSESSQALDRGTRSAFTEAKRGNVNPTEGLHNRLRVVIVGGGFGGLRAARALKSAAVDVTVLDRRNYHLFQPLLYQVATGSLAPAEIAAPLRSIFSKQKNTQVLIGDVKDVDPSAKLVHLADGGVFPYDYLIVAAGSQTSYYGHDGWREWAPGLKSIEEAVNIRHKILYAFEAAERMEDPELRREWLTFVIVGAGATGVELAGAIAEIARQTLKDDFRSIRPDEAQIVLLDGAPRVLGPFPEILSRKAEGSLAKLGVQVRTGVMVKSVDRNGLTLEHGESVERLESRTVIWAGGVTAASIGRILAERTQAETDRGGRIVVGPDLTIPGYPDIYVVGDLALYRDRQGKPLPGVAQVAMQQGTYAGRAILRKLTGNGGPPPFEYFDKGTLAVIGRAAAVADVFGLHLWGLPAWLIWVFIHLMYIVEFQSRLLVFIRWAYEDLTFNRGARLITGTAATDFDPYRDILGNEIRPGADRAA
jgi:NADH:ubiquinone reductase (H+-translocating)